MPGRRMRALFLIILLTSCGYQVDIVPSYSSAPTLSIPYVEGDIDGDLTSAIIEDLAASGFYRYKEFGCEYILKVSIINYHDENIGFRYDRTKRGKLTDEIIPVETRQILTVEVQLLSACSLEVIRGPVRIQASIDFDHDYYTIRNGVNTFSLGQLTDIDSAEDAALTPLHRKLAAKIVDYVIYGW